MSGMTPDIFFIAESSIPKRMKFHRLDRGLRQADVAYLATQWLKERRATLKIQPADIGWLEQGWRINRRREEAIFAVLGMDGYEQQ